MDDIIITIPELIVTEALVAYDLVINPEKEWSLEASKILERDIAEKVLSLIYKEIWLRLDTVNISR